MSIKAGTERHQEQSYSREGATPETHWATAENRTGAKSRDTIYNRNASNCMDAMLATAGMPSRAGRL
jgi:hypothetical protein